jgi:hypothetical protein
MALFKLVKHNDNFSYFPKFKKLQDSVKTGKKVTILKGCVDGFRYFSLIFSYFVFYFHYPNWPENIKKSPFHETVTYLLIFKQNNIANNFLKVIGMI